METSYSNTNSSPASRKNLSNKNQLGTFKDVLKNPEALKSSIVDADRNELLDMGIDQAKKVGTFLKSNWKIVVPVVAALGVGAFAITALVGKKALED